MGADVNILGPARQLLRVRERAAGLTRVDGIFGPAGPAQAVRVTFRFEDRGDRLAVTMNWAAWAELRDRVDRAFVFEEEG